MRKAAKEWFEKACPKTTESFIACGVKWGEHEDFVYEAYSWAFSCTRDVVLIDNMPVGIRIRIGENDLSITSNDEFISAGKCLHNIKQQLSKTLFDAKTVKPEEKPSMYAKSTLIEKTVSDIKKTLGKDGGVLLKLLAKDLTVETLAMAHQFAITYAISKLPQDAELVKWAQTTNGRAIIEIALANVIRLAAIEAEIPEEGPSNAIWLLADSLSQSGIKTLLGQVVPVVKMLT